MALPVSKLVTTLWAVVFLLAVAYKTVFPGDDPYRCRAVQNTGQWIDRPDANGSRFPFKNWQPDGCILHHYSSADVRHCLGGRRVVFGGDSTSRGVAYALGRLLERDESNWDRDRLSPSKILNLTYHGVNIIRYPNVWMHSFGHDDQKQFIKELQTYSDEKNSLPTREIEEGAAIVYLAAGVWYTNPSTAMDHDGRMDKFHQAFGNISEIVGSHGIDMFTSPMDPVEGVRNQLFYAPPGGPGYLGTSAERIKDTDRRGVEVREMQAWLRETDGSWNFPLVWAMPGLVEGQNKTWVDPLITGFHVIDSVAETRANILLNLRCNALLDRIKPYPYERTCCTDYGVKPMIQTSLVALGLVYLTACVVCELLDLRARREKPLWALLNMQVGAFVLALLMCYFADRTQMMAKGGKLWSLESFNILCVPCVILGLITLRKSQSPQSKELSLAVEPAQPFLSRDQTDEWKGWMQFIILIYHWVNSQSTSIFILVRLLVASYLFQTGYGHTLFFLTKKDFSFNRAAAVLLRLNLLSVSLAYFMNTDYMFYYFSPLVTFWFLVVYVTMAIGHKEYNGDVQFVLAKILISALVIAFIIFATPLTRWTFTLLHSLFKIQWSYNEWQYRVSLDIFIVYVGMLVAVATHELQRTVNLGLRLTLAFTGLLACYGYFHATASQGVSEYKFWHPYVSFVPVLAFIAIRNVSGFVRNYHSKAMAWLGRCSLETYTLQFHLLLAADTTGVLLVDGFYGDATLNDRWRSLIIIVPIFLWISSATATATGHLVKFILKTSPESEKFGGSAFTSLVQRVPGANNFITAPKARIACILLVLWLLNMFSPEHSHASAPDGFTPHRAHQHVSNAVPTPLPTPDA
ncbi:CAS1 domain-containing protein [Thelonectria olida]|uniref:CAS1 domain-containing protein n=1 Tax=Thelonectria olida TaxID=1576542 RepID=A0A9P8WHE6_9HYPO|nr:CAS1 domain-containing protein [Thelonectria olida]